MDGKQNGRASGRSTDARTGGQGGHLMLAVVVGLVAAVAGPLAGCRTPDQIDAPVVGLADLKVRQYSGGRALVDAVLEVENPNDFAVSLVEVDLRVRVEAVEVGRLGWSGEVTVGAGATTLATIPADWSVGAGDEIFTRLIDRGAADYALNGEITLARGVLSRRLPVAASGLLDTGR